MFGLDVILGDEVATATLRLGFSGQQPTDQEGETSGKGKGNEATVDR